MLKVVCALIVSGDKILLAQRGPASFHSYKWEFPGGKVGNNETPNEAIIREIKEELNLEIKIIADMAPVIFDYEFGKIELIPFFCTSESGKVELTEHLAFQWRHWDNLSEVDFLDADRALIFHSENRIFLEKYFGEQMNNS